MPSTPSSSSFKYFSYSHAKTWHECGWRERLIYWDKAPRLENIFAIYGGTVHKACEKIWVEPENVKQIFVDAFTNKIRSLQQAAKKIQRFDEQFYQDLLQQGQGLFDDIPRAFKEQFPGGFDVVKTEEKIKVDIPPLEGFEEYFERVKFNGILDLLLKVGDEYWICDWKTTTWGWDSRKKTRKEVVYQLVLYKFFLSKLMGLDPAKVRTAFILLKRTAKPGDRVEFIEVTAGPRRQANALNWLQEAVIGSARRVDFKNRLACRYCDYYKTDWCP